MAYIVGPAGPTTSTTRRPKALRLVTEDDECTGFPPPKCVRGSGYGDRQCGWREVAVTQGFTWMNEAIRAQQQSTPGPCRLASSHKDTLFSRQPPRAIRRSEQKWWQLSSD
jgi:hypothetical protein